MVGQTALHRQEDSDPNTLQNVSAIKPSSGVTTKHGQTCKLYVHNDGGKGQSSEVKSRVRSSISLTMNRL